MKTASLWGSPPSRFYRFLSRLREESKSSPPILAVLGCADGKFVLPAARLGFHVYALDADAVAVRGGLKQGASGQVWMPGLVSRLRAEGLTELVEVKVADFTTSPAKECDAAFTSGSIQYSRNTPANAADILIPIMNHVRPGGLLYIDYMLPTEEKYAGRPNCPDSRWWRSWCREITGWEILHNRVLPPVEDFPHVEAPYLHSHHWGHLLARRHC